MGESVAEGIGVILGGLGHVSFSTTPMEELVRQLNFYQVADRPIFDKTGLKGSYDFRLVFKKDGAQVQDLGLRLEPATIFTEMLSER
jgi:uncharacterized protein (TIGR03435 family)